MGLFDNLIAKGGPLKNPTGQPRQPAPPPASSPTSPTTPPPPSTPSAPVGRPPAPLPAFPGGVGAPLPLSPGGARASSAPTPPGSTPMPNTLVTGVGMPPPSTGPSHDTTYTSAPAPAAPATPAQPGVTPMPSGPAPGPPTAALDGGYSLTMDHVPTSAELATVPGGVNVQTPYGTVDRSTGSLTLSPDGKEAYQQAVLRMRSRFGPHPFAKDPNSAPVPATLGKPMYNPFINQWIDRPGGWGRGR